MATKRIYYFTAGQVATSAENTAIAALQALVYSKFTTTTMRADVPQSLPVRACDYVCGTSIPAAYAGLPVIDPANPPTVTGPKTVIFFVAGIVPTVAEAAQSVLFAALAIPDYSVHVKNYSTALENPLRLPEYVSGSIPAAYTAASIPVFSGGGNVAPYVIAAPTFNGVPQVGIPLSITAGTAGGTPSPTITRSIFAGGTLVAGPAVGATYTPVSGDLGKVFTVNDSASNVAGTTANMSLNSSLCVAAAVPIGPYPVGGAVLNGGRSYVTTTGDDFTTAATYVAPGNPSGKYSTTRAYMGQNVGNGPRANTGSLSLKGYDADALHTGDNDKNRGNAVASFSDLITTVGGRLQLKSRIATADELTKFVGTSPIASAMINTATSHMVMAPFFIECKMKLTKSQANTRGWHPTFWMMQAKNVGSYQGTELDYEATSLAVQANRFAWVAGASTTNGGAAFNYVSGTEYTYRIEVLADGSVNFHSNQAAGGGDGALAFVRGLAGSAGVSDVTRPFYVLLTNHVADFASDPYTEADWTAAGNAGSIMDVDYFAMMTTTGTLYQPLVATQTYNVAYGAAINITLPSATTLWGSAVTEDIESWAQESNEPGGDYEGGYRNVPQGLTYSLANLSITGTPIPTTGKATPANKSGRIMVVRYTEVPGSACVPHRTVINIGPHWTTTALPGGVVGTPYSYDLYAQADCGVLVSNASGVRTKTIAVTGLAAGLSYSDTTGLITGIPTTGFTGNVTAIVTNSVGQTSQVVMSLAVTDPAAGVPAPALTGSPAIRNSWDFDNLSTLTLDSSTPPRINAVAPSGGGTLTLANASATTSPTRVLRPNNRNAALFAKASIEFLQGTAAQTAGGSQVIVFEPVTSATAALVFERSNAAVASTVSREGLLINGAFFARRCSATIVTDVQTANAPTLSALHVAVITYDPAGTAITIYVDGVSVPGTGGAATAPTGMNTVTIGARSASNAIGAPFDGYVYRVIDYATVLTADQAEQVAVWAASNYGTPNAA